MSECFGGIGQSDVHGESMEVAIPAFLLQEPHSASELPSKPNSLKVLVPVPLIGQLTDQGLLRQFIGLAGVVTTYS